MTTGKYFNRNILALDHPYVGHVVRETPDKIVVFGEKNTRYDIPIFRIKTVSRNVLIDMNFDDIRKFYSINRNAPLPPNGRQYTSWNGITNANLASSEGKYPKSLFNKGVRLENEDHVGHVMRETEDKIVIFGHKNFRYDVPKSKIATVGRNVILALDWIWLSIYKVDISSPLPLNSPPL